MNLAVGGAGLARRVARRSIVRPLAKAPCLSSIKQNTLKKCRLYIRD